MTRKKLGIGLLEAFSEPCEACASRGVIVHHEPIMRSKNHHPMEDNSGGNGGGSSKGNKKKQKNSDNKQEKKVEVAKISSPEQAQQLGNVISAIAASTVAAHEAAGEESPIPVQAVKSEENQADLLESVLDALPEPKAAGQGKRKPRTRRGSSGK